MNRVLIVSQYFPPETFTAARRVGALAAALGRDHSLTVATLEPSYPDPSFYPRSAVAEVDEAASYRIMRGPAFRRHTRLRFVRALREQLMAIRLGLRAARAPADVVITTSPSMFVGPVCLVLARMKRASFVWDLRDITWEFAAETAGRLSGLDVGLRLLRRVMWATARRADLITVATPGIAEMLEARGIQAEPVVLLPNQVPSDVFEELAPRATERNDRPPTVAYVGLIGDAQGLGVLVEAAHQLPGVHFVVAGDGPEREQLQERARELGADNLAFRGYVGRDELVAIYRESDILFSHIKDTPTLNATAQPSKLLEYMATGRPLIHAGRGSACRLLDDVGCGIVIPPEDPDAIVSAIATLTSDRDRANRLGRRGRAWAAARPNGSEAASELVSALNRSAPRKRNGGHGSDALRRLRSNADATEPMAFMVVRMVAAALTATTTVLMAATLSKAAYGSLATVTAVAGALVVAADLGLTSSLAHFIARARADRALLIRVVLVRAALAVGLGSLIAFYGLAVQQGWVGDSRALAPLLYLGGALVVANSFTALMGGLLPVFRSLRALMVLTIVQPLLELVGVASVLALALGATEVMAVLVGAAALTAALGVPVVLRHSPAADDVVSLPSVARYGTALAVVAFSMAAFGVVDLLVIGHFHGSGSVAPYALALKVIALMQLPGLAIALVVAPRLVGPGGAALFGNWLVALGVVYAGVVTVVAVLAPYAFAAIGAQYRGDGSVLVALTGFALLSGIAPLVSMGANYLGGARRRVRLALSTLLLNAVLDVLLVPPLGVYGAALGTTVAFAWYVGGHLELTYRLLGGRPSLRLVWWRLPRLCAALAGAALTAWLVAAPLDERPWLALLLAGPAALVVYAVAAGVRRP